MSLDKIYAASKMLFDNMPFYGILSLRVRKMIDETIPTACISLSPDKFSMEMRFNPEWIKDLSVEQVRGVIEHELLHMINGHLTDPVYNNSGIDRELMNVAMDCEINQYINPKYLPEGVTLQKLETDVGIKLPEKAGSMKYYDLLKQEDVTHPGTGTIAINGVGVSTMDTHVPSEEPSALQAVIEGVIEQAAQETIKRRGTVPGQVTSLLQKIQERRKPVIDWKRFLRRFVSNSYKEYTITTRRRESRRFDDAPGLRHEPEFSLLVGIDTSGSVSDSELKEFLQEIDNIYKQKCDIRILLCDTRIHKNIEYDGKSQSIEIHGRGGTSFEPVLDYYRKSKDTCLVYFTDGECPVESVIRKPVLWIVSSKGTTNYLKDQKYIKING